MEIINILLKRTSIACGILFLAFSFVIGYYIKNKEATPDILFYSGGAITLATVIVLLFLLWIKKEFLPEELKEEDRKRQNAERAKEYELRMINLLKMNYEDKEAQAYKKKYYKLNNLLKNFKEEINKEINQSNEL